MRLETVPILLGVLAALAGLVLIADAVLVDGTLVPVERRRRERPPRHRGGELAIGLGMLAIAAALIGRDTWRFTNLAIGLAVVLVVVGAGLNVKYVRGLAFGPIFGRVRRRRATDVDDAK